MLVNMHSITISAPELGHRHLGSDEKLCKIHMHIHMFTLVAPKHFQLRGLQNPVIVNDFGCVKRLIIRCVVLTMHDDLMTVSSVIWLNHFGFQCAPNLVVGNV